VASTSTSRCWSRSPEWTSYPLYYAFDGAPPPPRTGAAHATIYPYGPFPTGADDGSVMLGLQNEREWVNFCEKVLLRPSWHATRASTVARDRAHTPERVLTRLGHRTARPQHAVRRSAYKRRSRRAIAQGDTRAERRAAGWTCRAMARAEGAAVVELVCR
jgi:crotonobetainyl-CoA:carnitine CoA-transferase CaiB-like acyl-CoA transferase